MSSSAPEEEINSDDHYDAENIKPMHPLKFYFNHTNYPKTCKMQTRCDAYKTVDIIMTLGDTEKMWFMEHRQFKHIFHMHLHTNRKIMGLWMLLLRTACTDTKKECWFVVNGVPIRYSLREHGLVCGLDCRRYPKEYPKEIEKLGSLEFVTRHFGENSKIKVNDVLEKLLSMEESPERLKMAVLYFLTTIIRGRSKIGGYIERFILMIVDNLDLCEVFPWGRFTFDDSIKEIFHMMTHFKSSMQSTWTFPRFILPLEVFAFECISELKTQFRDDVPNANNECPRMCKGKFKSTSTKGFRLEEIYETLGKTKDIRSILVPEGSEEILMARIMDEYEESLDDEIDPILYSWKKCLNSSENMMIWWEDLYNLDIQFRRSETNPETVPETLTETQPEPKNPSNPGSLMEALKNLEEKMTKSMEEGFTKINDMVHEHDTRLQVVEAFMSEMRKEKNGMEFEYNTGFGFFGYDMGGTGGEQENVVSGKPERKKQRREQSKIESETSGESKSRSGSSSGDEGVHLRNLIKPFPLTEERRKQGFFKMRARKPSKHVSSPFTQERKPKETKKTKETI